MRGSSGVVNRLDVNVYDEDGGTYLEKKCSCKLCIVDYNQADFTYEISKKLDRFEEKFNTVSCFQRFLESWVEAIQNNDIFSLIKVLKIALLYVPEVGISREKFLSEFFKTSVRYQGEELKTLFVYLLSHERDFSNDNRKLAFQCVVEFWLKEGGLQSISLEQVMSVILPYDKFDDEIAFLAYVLNQADNRLKMPRGVFDQWLFDVGIFNEDIIRSDLLPKVEYFLRKNGEVIDGMRFLGGQIKLRNISKYLSRKKTKLVAMLRSIKKESKVEIVDVMVKSNCTREKSIDEWLEDIEGIPSSKSVLNGDKKDGLSASNSSFEEHEPTCYSSSSESSGSDSDDGLERLMSLSILKANSPVSKAGAKMKKTVRKKPGNIVRSVSNKRVITNSTSVKKSFKAASNDRNHKFPTRKKKSAALISSNQRKSQLKTQRSKVETSECVIGSQLTVSPKKIVVDVIREKVATPQEKVREMAVGAEFSIFAKARVARVNTGVNNEKISEYGDAFDFGLI
jgi:hypothetical protein